MSASAVAQIVLLALTVAACACAGLGVLVMRSTWSRLHYVGLVTTVAAPPCAAAVAIAEGLWPGGVKALLVALVMIVTGPVVTHATARAARAQHETGPSKPEE